MSIMSKSPKILFTIAMLTGAASASLAQDRPDADLSASYNAPAPAEMTQGPEIEGIISARSGDQVQVTAADGTNTVVAVNESTKIKSSGGFLGLSTDKLASNQLINGIPVTVKTLNSGNGLLASQINLKSRDLRTASMIRSGTAQGFAEQTAATEALRGRMGDIDKYNLKSTTNVNFDVGKTALSPEAKANLCSTATQAEGMDNALLLVVGYADSTGNEDYNQVLSEKRANRVINYLQQQCGWKPYRMLTPTGMAEADPMASNDTAEGRAQNRRVAVNVMVSKAVDGF